MATTRSDKATRSDRIEAFGAAAGLSGGIFAIVAAALNMLEERLKCMSDEHNEILYILAGLGAVVGFIIKYNSAVSTTLADRKLAAENRELLKNLTELSETLEEQIYLQIPGPERSAKENPEKKEESGSTSSDRCLAAGWASGLSAGVFSLFAGALNVFENNLKWMTDGYDKLIWSSAALLSVATFIVKYDRTIEAILESRLREEETRDTHSILKTLYSSVNKLMATTTSTKLDVQPAPAKKAILSLTKKDQDTMEILTKSKALISLWEEKITTPPLPQKRKQSRPTYGSIV